ncbi:MAG: T9SS type A sorting domain-containing protein [Bacteroidales bacterium]|nr:T9SS type A sorting domain-containing protein [Bacteroidales bacterium]
MKKNILISILIAYLCLAIQPMFAQINEGGTPISFSLDIDTRRGGIPLLEMPTVDAMTLLAEDEIARMENGPSPLFRFGYTINVDIDLKQVGTKKELADGGNLWLLKIRSVDAYSINLIFDRFHLAEGSRFFIYNEDRTMVLGVFTPEVSNNSYNVFATELVQGNTIVLEYYEPAGSSGGIINISQVIHAYINTFSAGFGLSADCNIDVMCALGNNWRNQQRSVCLIIVGNSFGSGALVNNTNQDLTPYILTARHNFFTNNHSGDTPSTSRNPATAVFRFLYWRPSCDSGNPINYQSITGATLLAHHTPTDMALLRLNTIPPFSWNLYYAGWDRTSTPAQTTTLIHHPRSDVMKISHDRDPSEKVNVRVGEIYYDVWAVNFNEGTVQSGSSGAPLFNQAHRIVGQQTASYCGNDNDCACDDRRSYSGRFYLSWTGGGTDNTRLSNWLAPGLGDDAPFTLDGRRAPYISGHAAIPTNGVCTPEFTARNLPQGVAPESMSWSHGTGLRLVSSNGATARFERTTNLLNADRYANVNFHFHLDEQPFTISKTIRVHSHPHTLEVVDARTHNALARPEAGISYYFRGVRSSGSPNSPAHMYQFSLQIPNLNQCCNLPLLEFGTNIFGGNPTTQANPIVIPCEGAFTLTLRSNDGCGVVTSSQKFTATSSLGGPQPPIDVCRCRCNDPIPIIGTRTICATGTFALADPSRRANWIIPAGFTAITPTTNTNSVTIRATSFNGQTGILTANVINGVPSGTTVQACVLFISGNPSICGSTVFTLSNTNHQASWRLEQVQSNAFVITHSNAASAWISAFGLNGSTGVLIARVDEVDVRLHIETFCAPHFCPCPPWGPCQCDQPPCPFCGGMGCNWCMVFRAHPNPVDDILTIDLMQGEPDTFRTLSTLETVFNIRLLNSHGVVVRQQRTQANTIQFNVSNLPEGTYYLHIEHNGEIQKHQIIINRN